MPIRRRQIIDVEPLIDVQGFNNDVTRISGDIAEEVFQRLEPLVLAEVQHEPGAAVLPFEFATPASRRYYLYAVRKGIIKTANGRYQRSHRISQAWTFRPLRTPEGVQFVLQNGLVEAKWVYGSFDESRDYQVPGHVTTGWVPIRETADFVFDLVTEEYRKEWERVMPEEYAKMATRRRNR